MAVKPIPDKFHTVTPYLVVQDVDKLIEFVKRAFDATERFRHLRARGRRERVDAHIVFLSFHVQHVHQPDHAGFRCGIVGLAGDADHAGNRDRCKAILDKARRVLDASKWILLYCSVQ